MVAADRPTWVIREDANQAVLLALYLRQILDLDAMSELPGLRDIPPAVGVPTPDARELLREQWSAAWPMIIEPQAHPSAVPLDLVPGCGTLLALPTEGFGELRDAIAPHASAASAYARHWHDRYASHAAGRPGTAYRAYASAIAVHERTVGRRAHSFELNVQVLPFAQRGVWWVGDLTVAVTDGLRGDVVAFDDAIGPIIAELA